jgi:hypothetical protein
MLPSVNAQKLVETDPSWASVDETLTVIRLKNARRVDLIRLGYRRLGAACQPIGAGIAGDAGPAGVAASGAIIQGKMPA